MSVPELWLWCVMQPRTRPHILLARVRELAIEPRTAETLVTESDIPSLDVGAAINDYAVSALRQEGKPIRTGWIAILIVEWIHETGASTIGLVAYSHRQLYMYVF